MRLTGLVLLLFASLTAQGQSAYDRGMAAFNSGQYPLAINLLEQTASCAGPQAVQARYMAGVARFRNADFAGAVKTLSPIERQSPPSSYATEAKALIGESLLHQKKWQAGTQRLATQPGERSQTALFALLEQAPADTVKKLVAKFPDSKGLKARTSMLATSGSASSTVAPSATQVSEIRIALVLPLQLPKDLTGEIKSQRMAEFCLAARLAEADAQAAGEPVRLFFYDTYKNPDTVAKLSHGPDLASMDLLIGPIYPKETELLARFAEERKVPMINPLTNRVHFDEKGQYAFLAEPGADQMAAAALGLKMPGQPKKVACVYGTSMQDSMLAASFAAQAKAQGCTMALFKKVAKNSAANLTKFITEAALDSNSILFVPNDEPLVKAQLLSALEISRSPAVPVTYGNWIEETEIPLDRFERLRIRFLYSDYAGYGQPAAEKLRARIDAEYGIPATEVGLKAYDLVRTMAHALAQAKPGARQTFLKDYSPLHSDLSAGYDYTQGQTNGRVPIYRLFDGRLERE